MDVKIIFKNHPQRKWTKMLYQVFQCLTHSHLEAKKTKKTKYHLCRGKDCMKKYLKKFL